jgi:hypothetical protein
MKYIQGIAEAGSGCEAITIGMGNGYQLISVTGAGYPVTTTVMAGGYAVTANNSFCTSAGLGLVSDVTGGKNDCSLLRTGSTPLTGFMR